MGPGRCSAGLWLLGLLSQVSLPVSGESDAILIDVPGDSKRCVGEQFPEDSLGKWSFRILATDKEVDQKKMPKIRVTVKDPNKKLLYSESLSYEEATFAFTTKLPGLHKACIQNHYSKPQRLAISVAQGFSVKEYGDVVGKHLEPVSKQLQDSMNMVREIANEMDLSLKREELERATEEEEEERTALFGSISIATLLALSCWQIIYLRRFFRSKKLL
ncbi:emp24/gp25L/p24 family/GOLD-domain-containing protein [Pelagophyceae sp. CCMP2097]|nr:emp24/gp25L/p24 family/GOLD-domain-containing protein [Pelagophyceae sp. CCMP2097]